MQIIDEKIKPLYFEIDEKSIKTQKEYFLILNKLIDAICLMRYKNSQRAPYLSSTASLHSYIYGTFLKSDECSKSMMTENITDKLWWMSYCKLEKNYIKESILSLYKQFILTKNFDDTEFSNKILNVYRSVFLQKERVRILSLLKTTIPVSPKRKSASANRYRLEYVQSVIQQKKFENIYLTAEEFDELVDEVYLKLSHNKDLCKKGIIIHPHIKDIFKQVGTLSDEIISKFISKPDNEAVKYIKNVFNRFKIRIGRLYQVPDNVVANKLDFNLTNFQVVNQHIIDEIFDLLNRYLKGDELKNVINNLDDFKKFYKILPFVNLFREFEMNTFAFLIINYPKIEERIKKELNIEEVTEGIIYDNLYLVLKITKNFENMVDCASVILGEKIKECINEEELTEYLKFYTRMLKRKFTCIPSINIKYNLLTFTSGELYDKERLIIGRKFPGSCIDLLNVVGTHTYSEVLLGEDSDVIMVRNESGEFISRILAFRKGNVIQLVLRQKEEKLPLDVYKYVASELFNRGQENGDNIDYIVISAMFVLDNSKEKETIIDEPLFYTAFPHADTCSSVIVLAGNKNKRLNFYDLPKVHYNAVRKINYAPNIDEIRSQLCLYYYLKGDAKMVDKLTNNEIDFSYDNAIIGEDWLIIKTGENTQRYIFNTATEIAYTEIDNIEKEKTLVLKN